MFWQIVVLVSAFSSLQAELRLSVASNFREPMEEVAKSLEELHGIKTQLSFSSSGKLLSQIEHGKAVDLFLSADTKRPELLLKEWRRFGLSKKPKVWPYAVGALYLVSETPMADWGAAQKVLFESNKVAMANPRHAPYGIAAESVFKNLESFEGKQILGENVAQAYHFFHVGAVSCAFVSSAQALCLESVHAVKVPQNLYRPVRQSLVVLNDSDEVRLFLKYLDSKDYLQILAKYGYKHPDA